jgi:heme-degrading monooxygenase HmoA
MSQPAMVLLVKFKSPLSLDEVRDVVNSRIGEFRALEGLTQKYYLQDLESGEYAGLYLWDSADALVSYQASELKRTIAQAYQAEGAPRVEEYRVFEVLRQADGRPG